MLGLPVPALDYAKLLGIYIDSLNFDYHISQLCKKIGKKLHVLTPVFKYINISQSKLIANAFVCLSSDIVL